MIIRLLLPVALLGMADSSLAADGPPAILLAAADCSQAAADAAAQTGGRVLSVRSRNQDGKVVCVVTIIIPATDGGRPRRQTVVVPQ
jgi:hypothetical protein